MKMNNLVCQKVHLTYDMKQLQNKLVANLTYQTSINDTKNDLFRNVYNYKNLVKKKEYKDQFKN